MALHSLRPISKHTMQDRVYAQLKQALMSGAFAPGESVTLRGVAKQLGTSAMPIRDAISRLVADQALEMPSLRSIRVPLMSLERYESVLRIRKLLEGEAAALAASRVDRSDIDQLLLLNSDLASALAAGVVSTFLAKNQIFHFAVYRLSGDPLLVALIEKAWVVSGPYISLLREGIMEGSGRKPTLREHDSLIKALRSGDGRRARDAISADIETAAELYRSTIRKIASRKPGIASRDA